MKIALCQIANAGKPAANLEKSIRAIKEAAENGADSDSDGEYENRAFRND